MRQLYSPENGMMGVAAAMSGSGTNIRKLHALEQLLIQEGKQSFEIVAIITDTPDPDVCNARKMADAFKVEYAEFDVEQFYLRLGLERRQVPLASKLKLLQDYYAPVHDFLTGLRVDCVAYGGFMGIVAEPLLSEYININVHPADLRVVDENGNRKYTGDAAVRKAILAGEKYIRASTHLMTAELDGGPVILVSEPLEVDLLGQTLMYVKADRGYAEKVAMHNQNKLKEAGDWVIFPRTVQLVAEGKVFIDNGKVMLAETHNPPASIVGY